MRIAIGIVKLFPGGGLQRDCIQIAKMIRQIGYDVTIYTASLDPAVNVADIPVVVLVNAAKTNHRKQELFATDFLQQVANSFDLVVGFDEVTKAVDDRGEGLQRVVGEHNELQRPGRR